MISVSILLALQVMQAETLLPTGGVAVSEAQAIPSSILVLAQDTPVELMAPTEVSTAKARPGTVFRLRVNKPIMVNGRVVVPVGTQAFGEVVTAQDAGGLGKSGRMSVRLLHIQLGEARIPLEGDMQAKGTGAGSAGVAFAASLFNPLTLFHRGNNAKIKAGEIVAGFVSKDVTLDLSGPVPRVLSGPSVPVIAPSQP